MIAIPTAGYAPGNSRRMKERTIEKRKREKSRYSWYSFILLVIAGMDYINWFGSTMNCSFFLNKASRPTFGLDFFCPSIIVKLYPVCYRMKVRIHWKNTIAIKDEFLCIRIVFYIFINVICVFNIRVYGHIIVLRNLVKRNNVLVQKNV